jgi:hypothetical protein
MKPILNRERKANYLKMRQRGLCGCGCGRILYGPVDIHHMLPDTTGNRRKFPLFLNSVLNLQAVRHDCHMSAMDGQLGHITDWQADKYERFLERHPVISDAVNTIRP